MHKTLYISDQLKKNEYSKSVADSIKTHLRSEKFEYQVKELANINKNIWCRDYMPVRNCEGKLIKFDYSPSYLMGTESGKNSRPDSTILKDQLDEKVEDSSIILDGGAVEIFGKSAIVSDRIFRDNYKKWKQDEKGLLKELKDILEAKKLIVIPQYPYDFTGHVDGLVRFVDETKVLINDLSAEYSEMEKDNNAYRKKLISQWYYNFKMALHNAGLIWEELTYKVVPSNKTIGLSDAYGIYMNFLLLDDLILVPGFGIVEDERARLKLKSVFKREAISIPARELAKKGGIINCVTWSL